MKYIYLDIDRRLIKHQFILQYDQFILLYPVRIDNMDYMEKKSTINEITATN